MKSFSINPYALVAKVNLLRNIFIIVAYNSFILAVQITTTSTVATNFTNTTVLPTSSLEISTMSSGVPIGKYRRELIMLSLNNNFSS